MFKLTANRAFVGSLISYGLAWAVGLWWMVDGGVVPFLLWLAFTVAFTAFTLVGVWRLE